MKSLVLSLFSRTCKLVVRGQLIISHFFSLYCFSNSCYSSSFEYLGNMTLYSICYVRLLTCFSCCSFSLHFLDNFYLILTVMKLFKIAHLWTFTHHKSCIVGVCKRFFLVYGDFCFPLQFTKTFSFIYFSNALLFIFLKIITVVSHLSLIILLSLLRKLIFSLENKTHKSVTCLQKLFS